MTDNLREALQLDDPLGAIYQIQLAANLLGGWVPEESIDTKALSEHLGGLAFRLKRALASPSSPQPDTRNMAVVPRKQAAEIAWYLRNPQMGMHPSKRARLARILERAADVARLAPPDGVPPAPNGRGPSVPPSAAPPANVQWEDVKPQPFDFDRYCEAHGDENCCLCDMAKADEALRASVPPVQSDTDRLLERAWKDVAELRANSGVGGSRAHGVADRIAKLIAIVRAGVQPDAPPAAPACELHERGDDGLCITCRRPMSAPPAESVQQEPDVLEDLDEIASAYDCVCGKFDHPCARCVAFRAAWHIRAIAGVPTVPAPVTESET